MKIGPEHIGKKVVSPGSRAIQTVLAVGKEKALFLDEEDGVEWADTRGGWELVEEPKKPSEIIGNTGAGALYLVNQTDDIRKVTGFRDLPQYANDRIDAILKYLDEQFEKGNLK